jgi:hypothetical protein
MLTGLRSTGLRKIGMMYRHGHAGLRETGIDDASCVKMDQFEKNWSNVE